MNIVYGGSFNPPTIAHKAIVEELIEKFNPKNLIIVPTGNSYDRKDLLDFKYRFDMLKIAFPNCVISDIEINNQKYRGTLYTLDLLSKDYDDLYFVMGADNLLQIKTWIRYEELFKKYNFIIMRRNDLDIDSFISNELLKYKDHFQIIDVDYKVSSTKIRENLEDNKNMLQIEVYEYIKKNNLYKG